MRRTRGAQQRRRGVRLLESARVDNFFQPEPDSHSGETPATVDLDNAGILQLQRNMMMRQDDELDELSRVVSSTKHIGLAVNEELDLHARLLMTSKAK